MRMAALISVFRESECEVRRDSKILLFRFPCQKFSEQPNERNRVVLSFLLTFEFLVNCFDLFLVIQAKIAEIYKCSSRAQLSGYMTNLPFYADTDDGRFFTVLPFSGWKEATGVV